MNSTVNMILGIYKRLMFLYPAQFRDQFAEEMHTIFALTLKESHGKLLLWLILREAFTLPISIITAHWHEYNRRPTLALQGGMNMVSQQSTWLFRWTVSSVVGLFILFSLLVVVPYFALGLHLQPTENVIGGQFDPKGFSLYLGDSGTGNIFYLLTILVMMFAPVVGIALSIFCGVWLVRRWGKLNLRQYLIGGAAMLMGISLILFLLSPLGRVIYTWMFD